MLRWRWACSGCWQEGLSKGGLGIGGCASELAADEVGFGCGRYD